ncbi:hypothetical protein GCM10027590_27980 [Nocardiopsis nanhaiensis]
MLDAVKALLCDEPECPKEVWAAASRLTDRARAQGWQVAEAIHVQHFGDTVSVSRTDRCPTHTVPVLSPEEVSARTGC